MFAQSEPIRTSLANSPRLATLHDRLRQCAPVADSASDIPPSFFDGIDVRWLNTIGLEAECNGGLPTTCLERNKIFEALGHGDPALSVAMPGPSLTLAVIKSLASPQQREQLCRVFQSSAPAWGAFALTEPTSGSNAANLSLVAEPVSGGYRLNGRKCYIGNAGRARYVVAFATIDPGKGQFGVRAFLIWLPSKGLTISDTTQMLGLRAVRAADIAFRDCVLPQESLLGFGSSIDLARSFTFALKSFDTMRPGLSSLITGAACGVIDQLLTTARGSRTLQRHASTLAETYAGPIQSARMLCRYAAACVDAGHNASMAGSICKLYATELACNLIENVVSLPGITALPSFATMARLHRDFQAFRMMEGTRDMHQLMIARDRNGHHMKLNAQLQAARSDKAFAA